MFDTKTKTVLPHEKNRHIRLRRRLSKKPEKTINNNNNISFHLRKNPISGSIYVYVLDCICIDVTADRYVLRLHSGIKGVKFIMFDYCDCYTRHHDMWGYTEWMFSCYLALSDVDETVLSSYLFYLSIGFYFPTGFRLYTIVYPVCTGRYVIYILGIQCSIQTLRIEIPYFRSAIPSDYYYGSYRCVRV